MCHMSRLPKILSTRPKYCPRAHMSPRAQNIVHGVALSTGLWLKVFITMPRLPSYDSGILLSEADPECALATFPDCDELVASDKKCLPRKYKDSGIPGDPYKWNRYLARDPPSYDSGTLLSEADVKTIMDKMEARSKWLKANGKARPYLGKHQRLILARAKSEVGHRPSCDDPDRVREGYEKSTIAGDDPKAFRDKYRFLPYDEVETNLRNIWAAMQREAYKNCPHDFQPYKAYAYKAAFQQYKDANTNWKDVLLAYRADKIKEWNQDHDTEDRDKEAADVNTVVVTVIKDHRSGEDGSGGGEEPSMSIRQLYKNIIEWQSQRCTSCIPRRHFSADDEERRLAYRLSHALSQSRRPKLTKGDKALINIIVGKALPGIPGKAHKRSQNEEVRRRCRHKRCVMRR